MQGASKNALSEIPKWVWLALALAVWGAWQHRWPNARLQVPAGVVVAADAPRQLASKLAPWGAAGLQITPLAEFNFEARLLSVAWYSYGREATLSPVDLAIGWGRMSDSAVLDSMQYTHGGRFFRYRWKLKPPIPLAEITRSSTNVHVIPARPELLKQIEALTTGSKIQARGVLVQVNAPDGWFWKSSLTREDNGAGACELLWLTDLAVIPN